jgi:membrane protein implicated in regulation of membrane protease activity
VRWCPGAVLTLYLAALIFGLGTFAVQLFASSDAASAHHDGPLLGSGGAAHGDGNALEHAAEPTGADPTGLSEAGAAHAADAHAGHAPHAGPTGFGWLGIFSSFRFYMFAAIAFGAVGAPATAFGSGAPALTLAVALVTGVGLGALAALGFRALGRETLSSSADAAEVLGQVGRVLVACEKGRTGKVRLTIRGQIIDVIATTDEPRLEPGAGVIVQDVHDGSVHVCAAPIELLPG